ncbi:hypothetical protein [Kitasatospora sp. NPDC094015]|uniref:hypothetical protein n=1 Tax=Kitasatospora sp. NPDC094015 TaxID=3155205 RepID=UPI0033166785
MNTDTVNTRTANTATVVPAGIVPHPRESPVLDNFRSYAPERAARLALLVEQSLPLLEREDGMEAVQHLLRSQGTSVIDSIIVTRELLGGGASALPEAKSVVLLSAARSRELRIHHQLVEELEKA